jgi:hypothetical protein
METTLLVLAAGMGSRYGGLKQMDPLGPQGQTILDYSVYDALRSGFSRVVFVIRRDFEEEFREKVGARFEDRADVGYVFQQLNDLPAGFAVPDGREKPWGTGHAVWCARGAVDGPFLAINADDFYGRGAIAAAGTFLAAQPEGGTDWCMAGYRLDATLSPSGTVSRGVCKVSAGEMLEGVAEYTKIAAVEGVIADAVTGKKFTGGESVSMNCWGFTPAVFGGLEALFTQFLDAGGGGEKSEFYIPDAVTSLVASGAGSVRVLPVVSRWFGVTYREDRAGVVAALAELTAAGEYPAEEM